MFRVKKSIPLSEERQGYIYYVSLLYRELPRSKQERIRAAAEAAGGPYAEAVLEFVTTSHGADEVSRRHYISRETLDRAVRRYYLSFPRSL